MTNGIPIEDDTTLGDIFSKLCEIHEDVRDISTRVAKLEERAQDLEDARESDREHADEEAHKLYVLTSGRKCKCSICEG